jgi:acetylornithine/N-succinyldiaminopimelate aminotransferase
MSNVFRCSGYDLVKENMIKAAGSYIYDETGNRFVDFEAGVWALALGHNHPRINQVIQEQMEKISHISYRYTTNIVEQAAGIVARITSLNNGKCVFLSSGSEAVEFGVQVIRRSKPNSRLLTLADSFLASYGSAGKKDPAEWYLFDWRQCKTCPQNSSCDAECPQILAIPWDQIGGMVFESGSSSGLIRFPPPGLIQKLDQLIRENDGLILVNEVTAGMGRTGKWLGHQHYKILPDIIALGKGLGNGYPVSAVVLRPEIAQNLLADDFHYAQSHQNDPLGCAIAAEVITVMDEMNLVTRSATVGADFLTQLQKLQSQHKVISKINGRGLLISLTFSKKKPLLAQNIYDFLLANGFIVGCKPAHNLLRFLPPLNIETQNISRLITALDQGLQKMNL